jgi:hypothetical protein
MKVTLRQRQKGNKISLYLDYYKSGKREYKYLGLSLIPEPEKGKLTKAQKDENNKTLSLAETILSKRHLEIQNGMYGFKGLKIRWRTGDKSAYSSLLFNGAQIKAINGFHL